MGNVCDNNRYEPTREEIKAGLREKYIKSDVHSLHAYISWCDGYIITDSLWVPTSPTNATLVERKVTLKFDKIRFLLKFIDSINKPYIVDSETVKSYVFIQFIKHHHHPSTQHKKGKKGKTNDHVLNVV